jgi:ubiquinone/menaquinone biosynthesis C-methylase UbiE
MSGVDLGLKRFQRFITEHTQAFGHAPTGSILDFGCGAGGFVLAGLSKGADIHGLEVDPERMRQCQHYARQRAPDYLDRFIHYDGRLMPFPSNHFDAIHSWFVFEHVTQPQISLREIARVLKPGGTVILHADDVRNAWDGHAKAPWPPYLPREFAAPYLAGLGLDNHADFLSNWVVYISAPMIADIFETLGVEVLIQEPRHTKPFLDGLYVTNAEEARLLGETIKAGAAFVSPAQNLKIAARKR